MKKKMLIGALIGNVLEYYDVALYGFLALILAPIFFPSTSDYLSNTLASFLIFAAGFLARPIGSLLFGHFGDRLGRKKVLVLSIMLVSVPTFTIGILPSYDSIGIAAPLILLIVRLLQGLSVGGECAGITVFLMEHAKEKKSYFIGSLMPSTACLGVIISTCLAAFFTMEFMPDWAWRIPFLLGAAAGIFGLYLRRSLNETPEFEKVKSQRLVLPIKSVLINRWRSVLCVIGVTSAAVVPFQILFFYMNVTLIGELQIQTSHAMMISALLTSLLMIITPVAGVYADKIGAHKILNYSIFCTALFAYPLFTLMSNPSVYKVLFLQVTLLFSNVGLQAVIPAFMSSLFPTRERYSGIAFSHSVGMAIFGGITLPLCVYMVENTGVVTSPAICIILTSIIGLIAVSYSNRVINKLELAKVSLSISTS